MVFFLVLLNIGLALIIYQKGFFSGFISGTKNGRLLSSIALRKFINSLDYEDRLLFKKRIIDYNMQHLVDSDKALQ